MKLLLLPLALLALCGCASTHTIAVPACPAPAPLTPEMQVPAPPAAEFSKCLREVLAYGEGKGPMSQDCSRLLAGGRTR